MAEECSSHGARRPLFLLGLALALAACDASPHRAGPPIDPAVPDPRTVVSFAQLYRVNCAGCHGARGEGGAALGLASQTYLACVSDAEIRTVVAEGRKRTAMPAFAQSAGGFLSSAQVDALVAGIRAWAAPGLRPDPGMPPYQASTTGDAQRGAGLFRDHCGSCHGVDGRGGKGVGSIVGEEFLDLVSAQALRTTILAGRPDLGCPGFRQNGQPTMSADGVSDTVAWLWSQRRPLAGHPYRSAQADERKP